MVFAIIAACLALIMFIFSLAGIIESAHKYHYYYYYYKLYYSVRRCAFLQQRQSSFPSSVDTFFFEYYRNGRFRCYRAFTSTNERLEESYMGSGHDDSCDGDVIHQ